MDVNEALAFVEKLVFEHTQKRMTDLQRAVFCGAWHGRSFQEIHKIDCPHVGLDYLMKHVGPKLWQLLSEVTGEEVTKSKLHGPVERAYQCQNEEGVISTKASIASIILENRQLLPGAELELPGGQVRLTSPFYVERPPIETSCYQEILQPGTLIWITAPKQMGKTSLMARIIHLATEKSYHIVTLSFQLADAAVFSDLSKLFKWFCLCIGQSLEIPNQLVNYWDDTSSSNYNITTYFEKYLLAKIIHPLVIGLDEVDQVFSYPEVAKDFFGLLRAWHEKAKYSDSNSKIWGKLRFVVVHSTEVYTLMNINQLPFNVGLSVNLPEFNPEQVKDLAQRYGLDWSDDELEQLRVLVGGHPYLVQVALYKITQGHMTLNQLLQKSATQSGPYGDHLRRNLWNLEQHPELAAALYEVVTTNRSIELQPTLGFKLNNMGLVRIEGNKVKSCCNLYSQYFRDRLRGFDKEK